MRFDTELLNSSLPFCIDISKRKEDELLALQNTLWLDLRFTLVDPVSEITCTVYDYYGVNFDKEILFASNVGYYEDVGRLEDSVHLFSWDEILKNLN